MTLLLEHWLSCEKKDVAERTMVFVAKKMTLLREQWRCYENKHVVPRTMTLLQNKDAVARTMTRLPEQWRCWKNNGVVARTMTLLREQWRCYENNDVVARTMTLLREQWRCCKTMTLLWEQNRPEKGMNSLHASYARNNIVYNLATNFETFSQIKILSIKLDISYITLGKNHAKLNVFWNKHKVLIKSFILNES